MASWAASSSSCSRRASSFAAEVRALALRLGLFKVVRLDGGGGLRSEREGRQSFVHLEELRGWLRRDGEGLATRERLGLWREVAALLEAGVPAVNVCAAGGVADELFTYAGSGTLFTREDYCHVERLGIDDFEQVERLILRGQREGFLKPRDAAETALKPTRIVATSVMNVLVTLLSQQ